MWSVPSIVTLEVMEGGKSARRPSESATPKVVDPNRPNTGAVWTQQEKNAVITDFKKKTTKGDTM
jgi:hypothetical protein